MAGKTERSTQPPETLGGGQPRGLGTISVEQAALRFVRARETGTHRMAAEAYKQLRDLVTRTK